MLGNIQIISGKANNMKSNATLEELEALVPYMLVKYDYSKDGIITSEEALLRVCSSDLIDSLQHMYEMDGDMLISTYNNLIRTMHTLRTIKESIDKGGEVIDNDGLPSTD